MIWNPLRRFLFLRAEIGRLERELGAANEALGNATRRCAELQSRLEESLARESRLSGEALQGARMVADWMALQTGRRSIFGTAPDPPAAKPVEIPSDLQRRRRVNPSLQDFLDEYAKLHPQSESPPEPVAAEGA